MGGGGSLWEGWSRLARDDAFSSSHVDPLFFF